jgi:hypothetical protein
MIKHVGNCSSIIDWDSVIADLEKQTPAYVGPSHKEGDDIPGLYKVTDLWKRAGMKTEAEGGTVAWDMFFPGTNFDKSIADKFAEFVGLEKYNSCWISRIHIGRMAPWHWDVNDDEVNLAARTDIKRFHCHIGKPNHGHILLLEDQCFYNQQQGETYQWPSRTSWHAGMNSGLVPKYLFNMW